MPVILLIKLLFYIWNNSCYKIIDFCNSGGIMRVLIAVSDKTIAADLAKILQKNMYEVECICSNTTDTINYVEALRPDLIIMDVDLPGEFSAFDVTVYFNDVFGIPVVYLTLQSSRYEIEEAIRTEPYGFLSECCNEEQIYITLELAYNKYAESFYLL